MQPRDPVFGVISGPQKVGKTACFGYAFPLAIWIAAPGATSPLESVCGYSPAIKPIDIPDLSAAIGLLGELSSDKGAKARASVDAVVIDDFTLYIARTILNLQRARIDERNKYAVWDAIRNMIIDLRDTARRAKIHVFLNAHEQPPRMHNGARVRGGCS
jgi:hypothetical protein